MIMTKEVSDFMDIRGQLVDAIQKYLYDWHVLRSSDNSYEEMRLLETRLKEVAKTLSADELSEIVEKDLQTCIDCKTAKPLLWMGGLELDELPEGTTFGANYSPDIRIGVEVGCDYDYEDEKDEKCLFFYAETTGEKEYSTYSSRFTLYDMEAEFRDIQEKVEYIRKEVLGEGEKLVEIEEPTDEEFEGVSDFVILKEQLAKANHDFLYDWHVLGNSDSSRAEKEFLETRLNKALKTLSADEFSKIVEKDLKMCFDSKSAESLLWMCGLDLKELPEGSSLKAEYFPGVWIRIEPWLDEKSEHNLFFHVEGKDFLYGSGVDLYDMERDEGFSLYGGFGLHNMNIRLLDMLRTADYLKEGIQRYTIGEDEEKTTKEKFERISVFAELRRKLTVAVYRGDREEIELLKEHLNEAVKTLSAEEFAKIVEKDLQTCVDNKTKTPLLWICGLDLDEIPMGTTFEAKYSPDTRVAIEVGRETGKDKSLFFTVDIAELYLYIERFDRYDMEDKFNGALKIAEDGKEILAELEESVEELEDEELE